MNQPLTGVLGYAQGNPRNPTDAQVALGRDLKALGLRGRRGHDLRRAFITLAQVDGARRDLLEVITHGPRGDIVSIYTTFPWPALCAEVAKLRINRLAGDVIALPIAQAACTQDQPVGVRSCYDLVTLPQQGAKPSRVSRPSRRPQRDSKASNEADTADQIGSNSAESFAGDSADPSQAGPDLACDRNNVTGADSAIAQHLAAASATWLEQHDVRGLRRALLRLLDALEDVDLDNL
jgi:hypothetical protein